MYGFILRSNHAVPNEQNIKVVQQIDTATENYLNNGGTVLLTVKKGSSKA